MLYNTTLCENHLFCNGLCDMYIEVVHNKPCKLQKRFCELQKTVLRIAKTDIIGFCNLPVKCKNVFVSYVYISSHVCGPCPCPLELMTPHTLPSPQFRHCFLQLAHTSVYHAPVSKHVHQCLSTCTSVYTRTQHVSIRHPAICVVAICLESRA